MCLRRHYFVFAAKHAPDCLFGAFVEPLQKHPKRHKRCEGAFASVRPHSHFSISESRQNTQWSCSGTISYFAAKRTRFSGKIWYMSFYASILWRGGRPIQKEWCCYKKNEKITRGCYPKCEAPFTFEHIGIVAKREAPAPFLGRVFATIAARLLRQNHIWDAIKNNGSQMRVVRFAAMWKPGQKWGNSKLRM